MRTIGFRIASVIFGLMTVAHLLRLILHVDVMVGHHLIPMWTSAVGVIIAAGLSVWLWKLSNR